MYNIFNLEERIFRNVPKRRKELDSRSWKANERFPDASLFRTYMFGNFKNKRKKVAWPWVNPMHRERHICNVHLSLVLEVTLAHSWFSHELGQINFPKVCCMRKCLVESESILCWVFIASSFFSSHQQSVCKALKKKKCFAKLTAGVMRKRNCLIETQVVQSQWGLCALNTSWYPNLNGSHSGLPPSEIRRVTSTGLGGKIVWTTWRLTCTCMTFSLRPHSLLEKSVHRLRSTEIA